jgi:hypothetical protein
MLYTVWIDNIWQRSARKTAKEADDGNRLNMSSCLQVQVILLSLFYFIYYVILLLNSRYYVEY